jgi:hypothetical protein
MRRENQEEGADGHSVVTLSTLFVFCSVEHNSIPELQWTKQKLLHDNVQNEIGRD